MLTIDCDECVMRDTGACDDCVVSFVVGREPGEALVIDVDEERAVRMLAQVRDWCRGCVTSRGSVLGAGPDGPWRPRDGPSRRRVPTRRRT